MIFICISYIEITRLIVIFEQYMNSTFILFLNLGGSEVILILLVVLLLFGGKGVPNIAKALGKGIREFKDAADGIQRDIHQTTNGISSTIQEHIQEVKKEVDSFKENSIDEKKLL